VVTGYDRRVAKQIELSPRQKDHRRAAEKFSKESSQGYFQAALARWSRCRELSLADFQLHLVAPSRFEPIAESNRD